jgi:hypothetical protein
MNAMRMLIAIAATLFITIAIDGGQNAAQADPYRWCAQYSGKGARNCYFVTLEQCRAALSGNGGFCEPNGFYDGRPVATPEGRRVGARAH